MRTPFCCWCSVLVLSVVVLAFIALMVTLKRHSGHLVSLLLYFEDESTVLKYFIVSCSVFVFLLSAGKAVPSYPGYISNAGRP